MGMGILWVRGVADMPGDVSCEPLVAKEYVVGTGLQGQSAGPKPVWLGSALADLWP
jgi:hypothetical protein